MDTKITDEQFNQMISAQISLANEHAGQSDPGTSGAALMQSAARFNAFVSSTQCVAGRIMANKKTEHIEHYVKLYRQYLENHYDDYVANFDKYTGR